MSLKESAAPKEKCVVIIKPDAIDRRLQYIILSRISNISGLKNLGIVFHVASALVNQNQLSAEDRLRHWLTTEASMLTVWEGKDACELVGNMKREIRRQYAQTKSDGSLVDPMKNLLHSSDTDDSKKEYENWVSSFPYLHVKEDSVDKENPDEHLI